MPDHTHLILDSDGIFGAIHVAVILTDTIKGLLQSFDQITSLGTIQATLDTVEIISLILLMCDGSAHLLRL